MVLETTALEGVHRYHYHHYHDFKEEYYDPETEDRGITELITYKHRNGSEGTVKLLFELSSLSLENIFKKPYYN